MLGIASLSLAMTLLHGIASLSLVAFAHCVCSANTL